ncbi:hypothetical protein BX616_006956, partial [Lobosporangium transversale]
MRQHPVAPFIITMLREEISDMDIEVCGYFKVATYSGDRGTNISSRLIVTDVREAIDEEHPADKEHELVECLPVKTFDKPAKEAYVSTTTQRLVAGSQKRSPPPQIITRQSTPRQT